MTKSTKAALLSALVFPGSGHIYLKKYLVGSLLISVALIAGYYLVSNAAEQAIAITEKIQSGGGQLDISAISRLAEQNASAAEDSFSGLASSAILICWIFGIVDSIRIGSKEERE